VIKLKEELKGINNNKLSRIKVVAKQVRSELETHYDWDADKGCFKNTCSTVTDILAKELKKNGIYSYRAHGLYYGAPDDYEPDMDDWTGEEVDEYFDSKGYGEPFGFNHWWVVADNKWLVDITADQFHPDEPEQYRIVITDVGDDDYRP